MLKKGAAQSLQRAAEKRFCVAAAQYLLSLCNAKSRGERRWIWRGGGGVGSEGHSLRAARDKPVGFRERAAKHHSLVGGPQRRPKTRSAQKKIVRDSGRQGGRRGGEEEERRREGAGEEGGVFIFFFKCSVMIE